MLSFPILSPVVPAFKCFSTSAKVESFVFETYFFFMFLFLFCFGFSFHPIFSYKNHVLGFSNQLVRRRGRKRKKRSGVGSPFQIRSVLVWHMFPPLRGRKHYLLPWHQAIYKVSYILENQKRKHDKAKKTKNNTNIV